MKKLILLLLLTGVLVSCTYNRENEIVMDKNGRFYTLTVSASFWPSEAYRLIPVDTTKFEIKNFPKR